MTSVATAEPASEASKRDRITHLILDAITGLFAIGGLVALVSGLLFQTFGATLSTVFGVWTAVCGLVAFPALAVLALSKPRVRFGATSALAASASWFGRVVFSAFVFALSIVIGSVAGVVASNASERGADMESGLGLAFSALSTTVIVPVVLYAAALSYLVMGIRWCWDLGSIVTEEGGARVRALIERRWTGPLAASARSRAFVDLLIEAGLLGVSRVALILTLIAVGLSVVLLVSSSSILQ